MIREIPYALGRVASSATRLRALAALGPTGMLSLLRFLLVIVPKASRALRAIRARAQLIPDPRIRHEALASIEHKAYHVAGGAFFATFLPPPQAQQFIDIIAPLESLYDFLDNLCDRHPDVPHDAYPQLHLALADALAGQGSHDYYSLGPAGDDGGYLALLVTSTQQAMQAVPNLARLRPFLSEAAAFYTGLQTYKHLDAAQRIRAMTAWYETTGARFGDLQWWEFAAAAGSQFHVYALLFMAFAQPDFEPLQTYDAYFPQFCALHVLLDDFIDRAEDAQHGELNFITFYPNSQTVVSGLAALHNVAARAIAALPKPAAHEALLRTFSLFYLAHPKIAAQGFNAEAKRLLRRFEHPNSAWR